MSLTTLSCFVGLGLATACASGSAPQLARGVAVPKLAAGAPELAARASPAPARAAPPASQVTAPPEARELATLLQNVCQMGTLPNPSPGVPSFGCACCAPFDGCTPSDPAAAVEQAVYFPTQAVSGAFTSVGADQRALLMDGCESHVENYGGMVLLERGPQGFALHRYISGLRADRCWPVRRGDRRDVLVCTRGDAHQGTASQQLFVWDFAGSDAQLLANDALLFVSNNEMGGCWSEPGFAVSSIEMGVPRLSKRAGHVELEIDMTSARGV